ncbi:MAG: hypothetical protein IPK79_11550 [Vampirovibrionales bacterium]|nr:hypothetical protein [Vampirovibrionales bacterium]
MSTTLELVNEILRRAGQQPVTTLVGAETPAVQTLACLNQIYFEMLQLLKTHRLLKKTMFSTQAGIQSYAMPADASITSLAGDSVMNIADSSVLNEVDYGYPLRYGVNITGRPQYFWRQDDRIYFYPIPDAAYSIQYHYLISPQKLITDIQLLSLPPEYEPVLVQGALSLLEKFLGESGYQESYVVYRDGLAQLRARSPLKPFYRIRGYYRGGRS